jgi:hypothetical protein
MTDEEQKEIEKYFHELEKMVNDFESSYQKDDINSSDVGRILKNNERDLNGINR